MTPETISALVNMGSAGAVIAVVVIFLRSIEKRDNQWRDFFTAINSGTKDDIAAMQAVSTRLIRLLEDLNKSYGDHDVQAKEIRALVLEVKTELAKLGAIRETNRRRTQ